MLTNSSVGVDDIGLHLLNSNNELNLVKRPITQVLRQAFDNKGIDDAIAEYHTIKSENASEYDINENSINVLGYEYMEENIQVSLALFKLNCEEYPNSSNVYDSYGEALMKNGQKELAIENYKKSLELNPGNTNAVDMLKKMDVEIGEDTVAIPENILESYAGDYQLAPSFILTVTREGNSLFAQATKGKFEIFPNSETNFYYKVVNAQIKFNVMDGEVKSLTLFQNGQEVPGNKIR